MAIYLAKDVCFHCKKQKEFQTNNLCFKCEEEGWCIDGCQRQSVSRLRRCSECEKKHDKFMNTLKKWLVNHDFANKGSK